MDSADRCSESYIVVRRFPQPGDARLIRVWVPLRNGLIRYREIWRAPYLVDYSYGACC